MVKKQSNQSQNAVPSDQEHIRAMSEEEIKAFHRKTYEKYIRSYVRERNRMRKK
ncbi:hypothetical protein [Pseudalkalibacillus sp. SCS-8]|uniref:hypothetical protein n=1 Tax=Pseudalkalibacillus nanhaiensis TaxID=3115291 RepID=UPI0032D9EF3F